MHPKPTRWHLPPTWLRAAPGLLGSASVRGSLLLTESVVLFHFLNDFPSVPIILTGCIKSMSACGGRWNSAGVAPGAASPLLGNLCAEEVEAALFQLVTKAWPPWLVCLMDAFPAKGQQEIFQRKRAQARPVCSAAQTGSRHIWVSTVAKGVSWRHEDVAASLSLTKATEGVPGGVSSCPATHPMWRASCPLCGVGTCMALGARPPTLGSFWGSQRAQTPCEQMQIKTWGEAGKDECASPYSSHRPR